MPDRTSWFPYAFALVSQLLNAAAAIAVAYIVTRKG
jgi:uncharacterized membrane protein